MTRWITRPTKEGPSGAGRSPRWYAERWSPRRASSLAPPGKVASSNAIFHPPPRRSGGAPSPSIRQRGRRSRAGTPITHIEPGPSPADQSRRRQDDLTHRLVVADIAGTAAEVRVQRLRDRSLQIPARHRRTLEPIHQHRRCGHKARRTVTALEGEMLHERLLHIG